MASFQTVKVINWNIEKNEQLIDERQISFEDVVYYLLQRDILDTVEHPNPEKYPNQHIFVLNIDGYVYLYLA